MGWSLYEDPDRQTRIINRRLAKIEACVVHADWLCVCVHACTCVCVSLCVLGLASCIPRPVPHLACLQSRLPLWPTKQLSPLGERSFQSGGSGRLTCPLALAQCECDATVQCVCAHVYEGVYVYVSVWCFCPSGLPIMVNVPTGSFHRRRSGQCRCQVTETRRINQDRTEAREVHGAVPSIRKAPYVECP